MAENDLKKRKPTPYMGATKKGMHTEAKGKFEQLKMARKAVDEAKKEVKVMGDKTSKDKLAEALSIWVDLHSWRLADKAKGYEYGYANAKGGKIKKNYAPGGRTTSDKVTGQKEKDEAGQFGGVYGSKNKAVREKATRDLWKKLGIKMPSPGTGVSDQDKKVIENAAKSGRIMLEQIIKEMGPMGTTQKIRKNKRGGGKIKKNYAKGGGVRPASY